MKRSLVLDFDKLLERKDHLSQKVVFVGGMNLDIQSVPEHRITPGDSLIGRIIMSPGGVVRNIAENSSRLGLDCTLISVLGDDTAGDSILKDTRNAGVNTDACLVICGERSCCYSAFLDEKGEMLYAVNDMSLMDHMSPEFLMSRKRILDDAQYLVLDSNIPVGSIDFLNDLYPDKILLIDPVSAVKIEKIRTALNSAKVFKPNIIETEAFTGISLNEERDYYRAMDIYLNLGIERIFISAGSKGIYYADCVRKGCSRSFPVDLKSVTGAGDAASAALVLSRIMGLNITETAELANLTAASSLLVSGTINKKLSLSYLKDLYKEYIHESFIS